MTKLLSALDLIVIEPPQENESDMLFKVEAFNPPERCPECGFDKLYKHSSRKQLIMDLPIRLKCQRSRNLTVCESPSMAWAFVRQSRHKDESCNASHPRE